ncbi:MAG TPA: YfhO family protein [Bacteroidales bacterium]|nr:YfhO family protein [Bacteroidales bacterium]
MEKINFKKYIPYLLAVLAFIVIALVYFYPALEGKKLQQGDIDRFKGMSKEIVDFRKTTGEQTLWTNNMFSGMPAYFISVVFEGNLFINIHKGLQLGLPHPANSVFLYFLGFFILLIVLRVNPWLAALGAFAFAFSSYFFIIIEAGHNSKASAVAYMAPVIAGVILAYRGKYLGGALLMAFFLALELAVNHLQITYYLFMIILVYGIYELVETIRNKKYVHFLKATAFLIVGAMLAVGTHAASLMISADHTQYTTRGKSELTHNADNKTSGLDRDYITQWSYGVSESMTLLVPDFMGGSSYGDAGENSNMYDLLIKYRVPRNDARQIVSQLPLYWGTQPFTSGPVYAGAIIVFLFVLGLFIVKGRMKWWLLTITILSVTLAWGRNFMFLTDLFLDYFPMYNKFRAVTMILVIAEFAIPLLGIMALAKIFDKDADRNILMKGLKYSLIGVGGILLILLAIPGMLFDFSAPGDMEYLTNVGFPSEMHNEALNALHADRVSILRMDAFRSLVFILLTAGLIWLYLKQKIRMAYVIPAIALLVLIDMWAVNKRYLNKDNFVRSSVVENPFKPTEADNQILRDKELGFRVLNLTVNPFSDASTSYFHRSIGGYHGAKLERYQELIDFQIQPEMTRIITVLRSSADANNLNGVLSDLPVLNMLNTKYLIIMSQNGPVPLQNPYALGTSWFVDSYRFVENADEEIDAVGDIDPATTLIIDKRFSDFIGVRSFERDSSASITLVDYKPNHLTYNSSASSDQLAVFSEIYYPNGWNAFIDGQPASHFRANWTLRAMVVPAGKHTIEFKFQPALYTRGEGISLIFSILLLLMIVGYGVIEIRKNI